MGLPIAIAVAKNGEIFVADLELHIIYKVPAAGGKPAEFAKVTLAERNDHRCRRQLVDCLPSE